MSDAARGEPARTTIRPLSTTDLDAVARVHISAFPHTLLSTLGPGAVRRYYHWQLVGPHDVVALGAERGGTLVGFCFGGRFRGAMRGFVRRHFVYLAARMLVTPRAWGHRDVVSRARLVRVALRRAPVPKPPDEPLRPRPFSVLSIAVDPRTQRTGAGRALLAESSRIALSKGYGSLALTVDPQNRAAVVFYEREGWSPAGSPWTGRMVKPLEATSES